MSLEPFRAKAFESNGNRGELQICDLKDATVLQKLFGKDFPRVREGVGRLDRETREAFMAPPLKNLNVAYGPWLTKCGSTWAENELRKLVEDLVSLKDTGRLARRRHMPTYDAAGHLCGHSGCLLTDLTAVTTGRAMHRRSPDAGLRKDPLVKQFFGNTVFMSYLRHPLDRFLAGYHEMERFLRLGWISALVRNHTSWWNFNCLNTTWPQLPPQPNKPEMRCNGTAKSNSVATRLKRLITFLEVTQRFGFLDQHYAPLTYLIKENPVYQDGADVRFFDLRNASAVFDRVRKHFLKQFNVSKVPSERLSKGPMARNVDAKTRAKWPWIVEWGELKGLATGASEDGRGASVEGALAKRALRLMCDLYRADVVCFGASFPVPECGFGPG